MNNNEMVVLQADELRSQIREAVEKAVTDRLPEVIHKATRKQHLTTPEAAEYLGISKRSLFHLKTTNQLGHIQHGRKILYPVDELDNYIEQNRIRSR